MNFSLFLLLLGPATAFTGTKKAALHERASHSFLLKARPDSSVAVADALRISKEFGGTSSEARIAWETVEEMDAADMSPAISSSSTMMSTEKLHQMEYTAKMRSLNRLLVETHENLSQIKTLAGNLKNLDIEDPHLSKLPDTATGLKKFFRKPKQQVKFTVLKVLKVSPLGMR
jgi:hypothetical protein